MRARITSGERKGTGATVSNPAEDKRRRKERLARDLEEARANMKPTQDELAARPHKKGHHILGITAREFGKRIGVGYQTVLIWERPYDPDFPAEHNWPKIAAEMGISLDEFRSRYLFSQPASSPQREPDVDRIAALEREVAELRALLESRQETVQSRPAAGQAPPGQRRSRR